MRFTYLRLSPKCENGDFEQNIMNGQWVGADGTLDASDDPIYTHVGIFPGPIGATTTHQTIVSAGGYDPTVGGTVLPLTSSPTSLHAIRIGNKDVNYGCESISKTFTVTPNDTFMTFWYALVLENPDLHPTIDKPYFRVRVSYLDSSNVRHVVPNCTYFGGGYYDKLTADLVHIPFHQLGSGWHKFAYKMWDCAQIDLSSVVGKTVQVEFITADCNEGQHYGYAYVDNVCSSCAGAPSGTITLSGKSQPDCGYGHICFDYTLPHDSVSNTDGTVSITLSLLQNGVAVGSMSSPVLTSGNSYCFDVAPSSITGVDTNLPGFDYVATAHFTIGTYFLPPHVIGLVPDGQQPGQNNDYQIYCTQKWCCPGPNLVVNGDFERGPATVFGPPTWPGLGSQYASAAWIGVDSIKPGEYSVVTGHDAFTICPTWQTADHYTCNQTLGHVLVVNGKTNQPAGTTSIWNQTVPVLSAKMYHFCAYVKDLPKCCFNVSPRVEVDFTDTATGNLVASIPLTASIVHDANFCDWDMLSTSFTVPSTVSSVKIDIRLDESGVGDGNDLAIDDIALQPMPQIDPDMVAGGLAASPPTNGHYTVNITYPATLPGYPYGYIWQVCEIDSQGNEITCMTNPAAWWTYTGPTPLGQANWFNGWGGTSPGTFDSNKNYRFTFGAWSDCEAMRFSVWELWHSTRAMEGPTVKHFEPQVGDVKIKTPKDPQTIRGTAPKLKPAASMPPGAAEAALLPRAEDNPANDIAVPLASVAVGQLAPEFVVADDGGALWRLSDLRGKKNVLLTFFPKCFTGGCANHLSSIRDQHDELQVADTQVIAVSVDPADGEKGQTAFAEKWQLTFPLIPDTDRKLCLLYGAVRTRSQLAARMSFLIDKQGVVRYVDNAVNIKTHGASIVAKIHELGLNK